MLNEHELILLEMANKKTIEEALIEVEKQRFEADSHQSIMNEKFIQEYKEKLLNTKIKSIISDYKEKVDVIPGSVYVPNDLEFNKFRNDKFRSQSEFIYVKPSRNDISISLPDSSTVFHKNFVGYHDFKNSKDYDKSYRLKDEAMDLIEKEIKEYAKQFEAEKQPEFKEMVKNFDKEIKIRNTVYEYKKGLIVKEVVKSNQPPANPNKKVHSYEEERTR